LGWVVTWEWWPFDRFARSVRHLLTAPDGFRSLGVAVLSLREDVETSTPMFAPRAVVSELKREILRTRVQAGVDRARAHGE
jgi:DNA invertase Pin-like site-specific DNA recombinase